MKFSFLLCGFLCLLCTVSAFSQSNKRFTISGVIYEDGSRESLPGVVVSSADGKFGAVSNGFGFYSLSLEEGEWEVVYQFVGYEMVVKKLNLRADLIADVFLKSNAELKEVEVSAEKQERVSDASRMSSIDIPVEQIKDIPALLGEKDVLKVVQLMPGVQKGSEGSSGFYVRGGGPDQNLILLDDATVYNASHLFGFFSLFNGDALKSVELSKGAFPARYGGRLSSVLEMRMKDGNKEKIRGEAGIGLISSRLTLEGPVKKGKSSFLVSGRRTYIDLLAQPFILASQGLITGYYFYDFNAKYNHIIDSLNRIYVSGYFGKDKFYYRDVESDSKQTANFNWGNATGTVRWNRIHNPRLFSNTSLIFTNYQFNIQSRDEYQDDFFDLRYGSGIRDFSAKYDLDWIPDGKHYVRAGGMLTWHRFKPTAVVVKSSDSDDLVSNTEVIPSYEGGAYLEDDWTVNRILKVNYGLRLSYYHAQGENYLRPEPRISMRMMLDENLSFKSSYALMNQYVHLLSNTGVGLPTDLWVPATKDIGPQQSQQVAAGFARDFPQHDFALTIEGYYKWMEGNIAYKDGASFLEVNTDGDDDPLRWQENVTVGQGRSYGGEVLLQRKRGKLTGWVGYTLSWTKLQFDELNFGKEFFARYDRRHDISVVAIYKKNERFNVSATWVYGTGQAITLPLAVYMADDPSVGFGNMGGGWSSQVVQYYGEKNSFRMRAYHRADIAFQWHKQLKRCEKTFELGFYNLYNRKNPFYYYIENEYNVQNQTSRNVLKQISLFPILPSISWTYKW